MKKKTSISISYDLLEKVGEIATRNERSKAWIVEKLMEILIETDDGSKTFGEHLRRVAQEVRRGNAKG